VAKLLAAPRRHAGSAALLGRFPRDRGSRSRLAVAPGRRCRFRSCGGCLGRGLGLGLGLLGLRLARLLLLLDRRFGRGSRSLLLGRFRGVLFLRHVRLFLLASRQCKRPEFFTTPVAYAPGSPSSCRSYPSTASPMLR